MVDIDPAQRGRQGARRRTTWCSAVLQSQRHPAGRHGAHRRDRVRRAAQLAARRAWPSFNAACRSRWWTGRTVLLGDVARVHDGFAVQTNIVRVNGKRATYLAILKQGRRLDAGGGRRRARACCPRIKAAAPAGHGARRSTSTSRCSCAPRSKSVLREAVIAAVLVVADDPRSSSAAGGAMVIVCTSIPLAILVGHRRAVPRPARRSTS